MILHPKTLSQKQDKKPFSASFRTSTEVSITPSFQKNKQKTYQTTRSLQKEDTKPTTIEMNQKNMANGTNVIL